ncbi:MAG: hypothetical protein L7F77_09605 [Candidatus Magnetominusculus sp. LBB02]|nr:hypothetical protein [Candidatus Magnetominusculus sp. LBB02]
MAFPRTAGYPDYSSTGAMKFDRALWSGKLIKKFYNTSVIPFIANVDYEGEILEQGDLIYIRAVPNITIRDYVKGQKIEYERPETGATLDLVIDHGKYFAFACDDVDKWQSDLRLLDLWSNDASMQLKLVVDSDILATIPASVDPANAGSTAGAVSMNIDLGSSGHPVQITKNNVLDYIIDCAAILDERNVPETDRWLVIPAWLSAMIKKSDLSNVARTGDDESSIRNGAIGMIDRFTVYSSNYVSSALESGSLAYNVMFGHTSALTFASEILKTETLRAESTFGDLVRGLMVYGYKVIKPEAMGVLYATR